MIVNLLHCAYRHDLLPWIHFILRIPMLLSNHEYKNQHTFVTIYIFLFKVIIHEFTYPRKCYFSPNNENRYPRMYMISQNMKKDNFAIQYQYQKCNDAVLVFILHLTIEKNWYSLFWFRLKVLNATFNNISLIVWLSGPGENNRPVSSNWQTISHNVVSSIPHHERGSNSQL